MTNKDQKTIMSIAGIVLALLLVSGIVMVFAPMMYGVGNEAATALSVTGEAAYTNSSEALSQTVSAGNNIVSFLPWLGVGLAVLAYVVKKNGINLGI